MENERNYSLHDLLEQFPDNEACLQFLFNQRFKNATCPRCGQVGKFHRNPLNQCYTCTCGRTHIFPRTGTIFYKSKIDLHKWFLALYLIANAQNGITIKELQRQVGIKSHQSAWRMLNEVRNMIARQAPTPMTPNAKSRLKKKVLGRHHSLTDDNINKFLQEYQYRAKVANSGKNLFFLLLSLIFKTNDAKE